MRFAIFVEAEHEDGPRCGVDAVAEWLCLSLGDKRIDVKQGDQEDFSTYTIRGASMRRWDR